MDLTEKSSFGYLEFMPECFKSITTFMIEPPPFFLVSSHTVRVPKLWAFVTYRAWRKTYKHFLLENDKFRKMFWYSIPPLILLPWESVVMDQNQAVQTSLMKLKHIFNVLNLLFLFFISTYIMAVHRLEGKKTQHRRTETSPPSAAVMSRLINEEACWLTILTGESD